MATPTLLSVSNVALPNTADSGNVSVTAPTGANACVIGGTFYVGDNSVVTSLTGSQLTSTTNGGLTTASPTGGNYMSSYAGAFQVTATGSQTIRVQKTGGYGEGPTCQIAWLTVDDPTDFVRTGGFLIDTQGSSPDTLSVNLASAATDLVLGYFGTDGSSSDPSAPSGTTQQGTLQTTQFDKSIVFSVDSPGASTTTITVGSRAYPTLIGISLKAGGGGSTSHAATGAIVGPGSVVAGTAARTRAHPSSGALTGPGAVVVGAAQHNVPHTSSGALTGPGSTLAGTATRTRQHPSSGDLVGPGSTVAGTAARTRAHASSGVLTGPGSVVDGAAARTRQHIGSGDLVGPGAVIVGSADHQAAAGTHDATGALVGPGSTVSGSAARFRAFSASGALVGQGAVITGSAARTPGSVTHAASGVLVGPGSIINGTAARANPPVSHNATGALIGPGAVINGQANHGDVMQDTHDGFWAKQWDKLREREKKKHLEEIREEIEELDEQIEEIQSIEPPNPQKRANAVKLPTQRNFYAEQAKLVEQLIAQRQRLIELEEEEILLLL